MKHSRSWMAGGMSWAFLAAAWAGGYGQAHAQEELTLSDRLQAEQRILEQATRKRDSAVVPAAATAIPNPISAVRGLAFNDVVLAAVRAMPQGGNYSTSPKANNALAEAIQMDATGHLRLRPAAATPCYCSGATYLVFLSVLDRLDRDGRLQLDPAVWKALLMQRQTDGVGVWGRWNANGPGTGSLFHELGIGRNYTSVDDAQPGDFAKFWWSDEIGARERGHSVVFLGSGKDPRTGEPTVTFWSANQPDGYGEKTIPKSRIKRALISRLTNPEAVRNATALPARDAYLADMLRRGSTEQEMYARVGVSTRGGR